MMKNESIDTANDESIYQNNGKYNYLTNLEYTSSAHGESNDQVNVAMLKSNDPANVKNIDQAFPENIDPAMLKTH